MTELYKIWDQRRDKFRELNNSTVLTRSGYGYGYGYRSGSGSGSRSRVLMNKNWKNVAEENIFFLTKIAIYLSLGLLKGCPSYRKSFRSSKENIQYLLLINYSLFLWVILALLDPNPILIRIHNMYG